MDETSSNAVLSVYLAKREELIRFFTRRLGSRAAAEDLVQDLYVKLSALDPAGAVQNPAAFVYRTGFNLMLDRLKQQRRSRRREEDWRRDAAPGDGEAADDPSVEQALAARQRLALIIEALEDLPPIRRAVFRLHKFEGLSHGEVAAQLGISRSGVEKHVMAALKHLHARLD